MVTKQVHPFFEFALAPEAARPRVCIVLMCTTWKGAFMLGNMKPSAFLITLLSLRCI